MWYVDFKKGQCPSDGAFDSKDLHATLKLHVTNSLALEVRIKPRLKKMLQMCRSWYNLSLLFYKSKPVRCSSLRSPMKHQRKDVKRSQSACRKAVTAVCLEDMVAAINQQTTFVAL